MHLLDKVICNLKAKQEEYFPPNVNIIKDTQEQEQVQTQTQTQAQRDGSENNLNWDLQRQFNRIGLNSELWQEYYLEPIKVKEESQLASLLTIIDEDFADLSWSEQVERLERGMEHLSDELSTESEIEQFQYWSDYFQVNIVVWSAEQIRFFAPLNQGASGIANNIDRSTMIFFQSATGQFRPMVHRNYRLHGLDYSDLLIGLLVQQQGELTPA